ncbi:MAG TPA: PAS domain-containing protein [Candidatus Binatia bacterium]|nr:PAS domain-containing protein [Candidatus Binatia bacterium]
MAEHQWLEGAVCFVDRDEIKSSMIASVEETWERLRGARAFPARRDIDPVAFKEALPYLSLVDIHEAPFRVHYRLVGTEVARFAEQDFSNLWLEDTGWEPRIIEVNRALYRRLWETRAPVFGLSLVDWDRRQKYCFEWGLFPLSDDGDHVNCSLSVDDFTPIAGRTYLLR